MTPPQSESFENCLRSLRPADPGVEVLTAAAYEAGRRDGLASARRGRWTPWLATAASLAVAAGSVWFAATNTTNPTPATVGPTASAAGSGSHQTTAPPPAAEAAKPTDASPLSILALRLALAENQTGDPLAALPPASRPATQTTADDSPRPRPPTLGQATRDLARYDL